MANGSPLLVRYKDATYDLTDFAHKHPGGVNTLKGLHNRDMQERFDKAPGHSSSAKYLMREYKICDKNNNDSSSTTTYNNGHANGTQHEFSEGKRSNGTSEVIREGVIDESMEHLVDWSKPMLVQIPTLGKHYVEWVNKPVDRELRLFGPVWLENLTKTPWWVVPAFWVPSIVYIIHLGVRELVSKHSKEISITDHFTTTVAYCLAFGAIAWTLLEYSLHRWVFHLDPRENKYLHVFHFLLHGLHHKVPFDQYRLVFPPVPAVLLAGLFYQPVRFLLPHPQLVLAGGLIGYLSYDMIHYYIHYGSPRGGHLYHMKRYHYQHHFVHHDLGFGISSALWDNIFGTPIILRKLKYLLKW
ncbi:uncharacterized protein LOC129771111 [Toxorhynchites rutilus septentrionalis]|uniref:uncharacterized protein LOC129771111 n=1 Tax=Toxorhynchites rutilus septentrionalis TaxID=329112 RepID=UPI002479AF62|nr:uncharacterized protein LOC129771111 [Toxorhynchites rutilus septentrionalis]